MKIYAILPCAVLAAAFCTAVAFADAPSSTTTTTTTTTTASKPAMARQFNYAAQPVSLLVLMGTLPDDEKTKIQAIDDKLKSDTEAVRASSTKEDFRPKAKALMDQANADITASLTSDQIAAIDNYAPAVELLAMSIKGGSGAIDKLNITTDQLNKLKAAADDLAAKQKEAQDEFQQKQKDNATAAKGAAADVLTDDQKAMLDAKPAPRGAPRTTPAK